MAVMCEEENRCLTAAVSGELDHHRAKEVMEELAEEAGDQSFQKILKAYRHFPVRPFSRWIGRQLRRKKHAPLVDLLTDRICEETKKYPCRSYGGGGGGFFL